MTIWIMAMEHRTILEDIRVYLTNLFKREKPWAHLPNQEYINKIIRSIKKNPENWGNIYPDEKPYREGLGLYFQETYHNYEDILKDVDSMRMSKLVANDAAYDNSYAWVWYSTRDACLVLWKYPECSYMLDCEPEELEILAKLGDVKAFLMLPACIALSKEKSK